MKYVPVDRAHRGPVHAIDTELVARERNFDLLAGDTDG